jgi:pyruvate kinase
MRRMRRAKIVATVGPSSSTPEKLRALFLAGVDVFRLNFSHGTQAEHRSRFEAIRAIEKDLGRPIGILMDLQGPKLRVGTFGAGFIELAPGQRLHLDLDAAPGDSKRVGLPHPEIFAALKPDTSLLLDDGKLRVVVKSCGAGWADTEVLVGGRLSDRKGVNVPDVVLPVSPLTAKDCSDLEFGLSLGADWVALSFVQRVEDIDEARTLIGERASVMAKIEKPAAIECLDANTRLCVPKTQIRKSSPKLPTEQFVGAH